jgi:hypothetical protein
VALLLVALMPLQTHHKFPLKFHFLQLLWPELNFAYLGICWSPKGAENTGVVGNDML